MSETRYRKGGIQTRTRKKIGRRRGRKKGMKKMNEREIARRWRNMRERQ